MDTEQVSERIELLVDRLRADKTTPTSLSDVASVTEVLLTIMRRYFNSIDVSVYGELRHLYEHIQEARHEILELRPNDLKNERIPRAGKELEAIVQATEQATSTIMDAAEEIMSADSTDLDAYTTTVNDACMRIFEACSFQDITGQRITKVVNTLTHIEERLNGLQKAWGSDGDELPDDIVVDDDDEEAGLLNGPALAGEGVDQSAVDNLLAGGAADAPDAAAANDDEAADAAPDGDAAEPAPAEDAEVKPAKKPEAKKQKPAAKPEPEAADDAGKGFSQADIDALFD